VKQPNEMSIFNKMTDEKDKSNDGIKATGYVLDGTLVQFHPQVN